MKYSYGSPLFHVSSFFSKKRLFKLRTTFGICDPDTSGQVGRIFKFRHARTKVDYYFIVEDNICRLIINVKPELKLIRDLLPIVLPSSPAIANTFVVSRVSHSAYHETA